MRLLKIIKIIPQPWLEACISSSTRDSTSRGVKGPSCQIRVIVPDVGFLRKFVSLEASPSKSGISSNQFGGSR